MRQNTEAIQRLALSGIFWRAALFGLPSLFLVLMLGFPLFWIVRLSLGYPGFDLRAYIELYDSAVHLRVVGRTAAIAAMATVAALVLGYPLAYVMAELRSPWRQLVLSIVSLPLWTSLLVRTYAWIIILAPNGPISRFLVWCGLASSPLELLYNRLGTVIGLTHSVLPYLILPIYASFLKLDPALIRAAGSLGARPAGVFIRIILPLTMPGVVSGCLFSFLLGLGAFVIPALLGGPSERSIAMMIESTANQQLNWNLAAALALEFLAATLVFIFVQHWLFGLGALLGTETPAAAVRRRLRPITTAWRHATDAVATLRGRLEPVRIITPSVSSRAGRNKLNAVMVMFAGAAALFLALPLFVVVPVSFSAAEYLQFPPPGLSLQWYERYLTNPRWLEATVLSVAIALIVVATSVTIGAFAAIAFARSSRWSRMFLGAACLAPMILPNMIIALGLFFTFARLHLVGTVLGLVLAHSLLAVPFVFISASAGLREVDGHLERAAAVLGARPLRVFARITVPLLRPFLLTGGLFAFIISFDEIVCALFLTSVSVRTLPKMMWENIVMFVDPTISAVAVLLIATSSFLMLMSQKLQRSHSPT